MRVAIDGPIRIDVDSFEAATRLVTPRLAAPLPDDQAHALGEAANLYQGDLLEGWDQQWCMPPREHLQRRFLTVMETLLNHFETTNDDSRAMTCAARALEIDPALRKELGASPDRSTTVLFSEIRGDTMETKELAGKRVS